MTEQAGWIKDGFGDFVKSLPKDIVDVSDVLARQAALESLDKLGIPSTDLEEWKYTNVLPVLRQPHAMPSASASIPELSSLMPYFVCKSELAIRLVFVDGIYATQLSNTVNKEAGVTVSALSQIAQQPKALEILKKHYAKYAHIQEQAVVALNSAFMRDGVFVHVATNSQARALIEVLHINTGARSNAITCPRLLVVAEKSSEVSVLESFIGLNSTSYLCNPVCEIAVSENAAVKYCKIVKEGQGATHLGSLHLRQAANSRVHSTVLTFGGKTVRSEIAPVLEGEGIELVLNGFTVANSDQHVDNHTVIDHAKPHCHSRELYKGLYADKATGVFNGTIIVRQHAQKTDAIQNSASILLSDDASVNTKPQLKIWADDVKCTHGATIGQLDEQAMFYLRSRGISQRDARRLLVEAFAHEVVSEIPGAELRDYALDQLKKRLEEVL